VKKEVATHSDRIERVATNKKGIQLRTANAKGGVTYFEQMERGATTKKRNNLGKRLEKRGSATHFEQNGERSDE
jgi:hypothetical protein